MSRFICLAVVGWGLLFWANAQGQGAHAFDGRPWHVSTGNLSVTFIRGSPIGAFPRANHLEAPPGAAALVGLKEKGLVSDEDYVAWGAVEAELW
jgi:hypothetical protein